MKPVNREPLQLPHFINDSEVICERLKQLPADELRTLLSLIHISDRTVILRSSIWEK